MGVWLSGENGQDTTLSNFVLMYFEKGQIFKICFCKCRKHYIFPCTGKMAKFSLHTFRFVGPNLNGGVLLIGACWVGGVVVLCVFWGHLTWP